MPTSTRTRPAQHRDDWRHRIGVFMQRWTLRAAVGIALLLAVAALFIVVAQRENAQEQTGAVIEQRDAVARDLQEDATTIAALCATGGEVARALEIAGQCGKAAQRLTNPVVAAVPPALSPDQINAIVSRVLALAPQPESTEDIVAAVLARIAADPSLRGLSEAEVRAIVASALAEQDPPADGRDGTSFGGISFGRNADGQCVAIVTFVEPDGSTRTETSPVGEQVCAGDEPPPPPTTTAEPPPPPPTTTTTQPPSPTTTTEPPPPTTTTPATDGDSNGLLDVFE